MHLSDLHLGYSPAFLGDRAEARQKERDLVLSKAVDVALASDVDMLIIAGDLFDCHNPPAPLAEYVLRELQRLADAGIAAITVPGNHDEISYGDSVYRTFARDWPGVLVNNPLPAHVTTLRLRGQDVHIYSLAYTSGVTAADVPLNGLPHLAVEGMHIAVFHGSLDIYGGERSLPLSSVELAATGYDYVALGHFHKFSHKRRGKTEMVYCGAVEARSCSDSGCGHVVITELGQGEARITKMPVEVRPHQVVELEIGDDLEHKIQSLADPQLVLRVRLLGITDLQVSAGQLTEKYAPLFYHLEVVDQAEHMPPQLLEEWANEVSVRGLFVQDLQQKIAAAEREEEAKVYQRALIKGLRAFREVTS